MSRQLTRLGVEWSRVSAVDSKAMSEAELAQFRTARKGGRVNHEWAVGQIGCFLSHLNTLRTIGEGENEWAAVFEDDVHIHDDLRLFLTDWSWIPEGADIVRFETMRHGMRLGRSISVDKPGYELFPVEKEAWGAAAYAIRRDVARWLAASPASCHTPTDYFLFHQPSAVAACLRTLQLNPALCIQDNIHPNSRAVVGFESDVVPISRSTKILLTPIYTRVKNTARKITGKRVIEFKL